MNAGEFQKQQTSEQVKLSGINKGNTLMQWDQLSKTQ